jgi:hypothetical protein
VRRDEMARRREWVRFVRACRRFPKPPPAPEPEPELTGDCSVDCLERCAYPGQFSECDPGDDADG